MRTQKGASKISLSAMTTTLIEPEVRPFGSGLAGAGGLLCGLAGLGGGAALGAPFGKALSACPEMRAAMVNGRSLGTICAISSCGCGLTRTWVASSSEAFLEEVTSGAKLVLAFFSGVSAPTLAKLSDCRLAVTWSLWSKRSAPRCIQIG